MEKERRILQVDLFKVPTSDLVDMVKNKAYDSEQRYQILGELQRRNADGRRKQFLESE